MPAAGPGHDGISVVVPTRGRPEMVRSAVRSALAQTHPVLEVIVVVDGPDPLTERAIREETDPRIRLIVNSEPLGGSGARNTGVESARGTWIAFLDDDDEWLPAKLEHQMAAIARSGAREPIAFCPVFIRTPRGLVAWRSRPPRAGEHVSEYLFVRTSLRLGEGTVGTSTIVARRELLGSVPFDPSVPRYQDADWLLRATVHGATLVFSPERDSIWTEPARGASITAQYVANWRYAFGWIGARRQLVTPRAYAAFLLVRVAALADEAGDREARWAIWREARANGRPGLAETLLFAARMVMPSRLRVVLRRMLAATRS
jgi:glycosyltransferase involved in cell wall biosynthesis